MEFEGGSRPSVIKTVGSVRQNGGGQSKVTTTTTVNVDIEVNNNDNESRLPFRKRHHFIVPSPPEENGSSSSSPASIMSYALSPSSSSAQLSPTSSGSNSSHHQSNGMESDNNSELSGGYPNVKTSSRQGSKTSGESSPSLSPTGGQGTGTGTTGSGTKASKTRKSCDVCGDIAKSLHFGGLSCDSCKAFFRRSVHNDAYLSFGCSQQSEKSSCTIDKQSRKSCQKCRFEKCIRIGMEKKWVMSEAERSLLNKQRSEKKRQASAGHSPPMESSSSNDYSSSGMKSFPAPQMTGSGSEVGLGYIPQVDDMLTYMTSEEQQNIREVCEYYRISYAKIPYNVPLTSEGIRNTLQTIGMFTTILRRFAYFSKLVPEFCELGREDQGNLLKASVLEMVMLRGALSFDIENHKWPNTNLEFLQNCPQLRVEDMKGLVSPELFEMHMSFIARVQKLQVDEPTTMLLLLIVMFYPERSDLVLEDVDKVAATQEKYCELLRKYVNWRYGPEGSKLYPKLLTQLADLRQLNDFHTEYHLNLAEKEVNVIRQDLSHLKLEPYAQWKIVNPDPVASGGKGSPKFPSEFSPPIVVEVEGSPQPQPPSSGSGVNLGLPHDPTMDCSVQQPHPLQQQLSQQQQSGPGPIRSSHNYRAHTRMREAFLRRIPQLIDDPFGPLMSPEEMMRMGQAYGGMLKPSQTPVMSTASTSTSTPMSTSTSPPTTVFDPWQHRHQTGNGSRGPAQSIPPSLPQTGSSVTPSDRSHDLSTPNQPGNGAGSGHLSQLHQFQQYINDPNNQLLDLSNLGNFQNIMDSLDDTAKTRLHSLLSGGDSPNDGSGGGGGATAGSLGSPSVGDLGGLLGGVVEGINPGLFANLFTATVSDTQTSATVTSLMAELEKSAQPMNPRP